MWHPLAEAGDGAVYPTIETSSRNCTPSTSPPFSADAISFTAVDPLFPLSGYEIVDNTTGARIDAGTIQSGVSHRSKSIARSRISMLSITP